MQRLSENGARPVATLGRLKALPGLRLGALVFQPNKTETLCWASLWALTRIAGCALGDCPTDTRWENVSPERRSASWLTIADPTRPKVLSMPGELNDRRTISFFALDRGCGAYPKNSRQQPQLLPGADASAIHGRTERSGCTAAEPYPLSRSHTLPLRPSDSQTNTNYDLKDNPTGLTASLIAVSPDTHRMHTGYTSWIHIGDRGLTQKCLRASNLCWRVSQTAPL